MNNLQYKIPPRTDTFIISSVNPKGYCTLEGEIRFTTLVRKNCLFAKSIRGAEANAIYYTLVATAKVNKLDVYKYFKYLFDRLPNQKSSDIEAFLPWAEEVQQECHN